MLRLAPHSMLAETLPLHSVRQRLLLTMVVLVSISSLGWSPKLEVSPQPITEQTVPGFRSMCGEGRRIRLTYLFSVADLFSWVGSEGVGGFADGAEPPSCSCLVLPLTAAHRSR